MPVLVPVRMPVSVFVTVTVPVPHAVTAAVDCAVRSCGNTIYSTREGSGLARTPALMRRAPDDLVRGRVCSVTSCLAS